MKRIDLVADVLRKIIDAAPDDMKAELSGAMSDVEAGHARTFKTLRHRIPAFKKLWDAMNDGIWQQVADEDDPLADPLGDWHGRNE